MSSFNSFGDTTRSVIDQLRLLGTGQMELDVQRGLGVQRGLCIFLYVDCRRRDLKDMLLEVVCQWPGYSGDPLFPVPHPSKSPCKAYAREQAWVLGETTDPYILARRNLCLWFADYLENENGI